jgi:uncharacterized protein
MIGTWINFAAIIVGGALGVFFGSRLSPRIKNTILGGMGLFVFAMAIQMFLKTTNTLFPLGGIVIGGLLGEWMKIEEGFASLGSWLESRFSRNHSSGEQERFIRGFISASIIFISGPVAILGSIQDGAQANPQLLIVKSVLDGLFAMTFASSMGIGVAFSALPVLAYQGVLTLLSVQLNSIINTTMMNELSSVGGVVLMGVAVSSILEIKKLRVGSLIPALLITPLLVWLCQVMGWISIK